MDKQNPPATGYLDILFANRNKQYGAYELRSNYNRRMLKASIIALSVVALLTLLSTRSRNPSEEQALAGPSLTDSTIVDITKVFDQKEPEQPKGHTGRTAKTAAFTEPVIIQNKEIDKPALKMPDKDALAGPVDNEGLDDGTAIAMDDSRSEGTGDDFLSRRGDPRDTAEVAKAPEPDNKVRDVVDEMPEFPGGMEAWKRYLSQNLKYPHVAQTEDIQGTVYVNFVVGKDGGISNIKVTRPLGGGCSEEAIRVLQHAPKWKAGRQQGYAVNVRMTLPIRFALH